MFAAADHQEYVSIPPATNKYVVYRPCRDGWDAKTFWVDRVMGRGGPQKVGPHYIALRSGRIANTELAAGESVKIVQNRDLVTNLG